MLRLPDLSPPSVVMKPCTIHEADLINLKDELSCQVYLRYGDEQMGDCKQQVGRVQNVFLSAAVTPCTTQSTAVCVLPSLTKRKPDPRI